MRLLVAAVATALCTALPGPVEAQTRPVTIGRLNAAQMAQLRTRVAQRQHLGALLNRAVPRFRIPAESRPVVICEIGAAGQVSCFLSSVPGRVCPSAVDMEIPGTAAPVSIPVTCTGPDADGGCECQFTGGSDP